MTNDKQRERLVELLQEASKHLGNKFISSDCDTRLSMLDRVNELRADYLLANGVIVPPFEIGTRVYTVITNMPFVHAGVYECEVEWYSFGKDGLRPTVKVKSDNIIVGAKLQLYLEDLYLTREEAEQALVTDKNVGSKKEEGEQE